MGKLFGLIFFLAGIAAIYQFGVRPLMAGPQAAVTAPITIVPRHDATPIVLPANEQDVAAAANRFLGDWEEAGYGQMYGLLTAAAQARISRPKFISRYQAVMAEATAQQVRALITGVTLQAPLATVTFTETIRTSAVGEIAQVNTMHLLYERGHWGVDWYPALIFKELDDPYVVHLVALRARRGSILDRHGTPLAEDGQFEQLGVVPGQIVDEPALLQFLSSWLHMPQTQIKHLYTLPWAQPDFFMPITTLTQPQLDAAPSALRNFEGAVQWESTPGRIYPQGSTAGILVGYVDPATDRGKAGLELSLDGTLAGRDGAELLVMNQAHTMTAATIARVSPLNGHDVRLTLDLATQKAAEKALGLRPGAAVALDPRNGQVLALASTPGFDPNRFEAGSTATSGIGPIRSMFPRATLGTYPTGSVFKIVTMGAALQNGFTAGSMIAGPGLWYGLSSTHPLHDWLAGGHGTISLQEALTESCDTCFYQVGKELDGLDQSILPKFARQFGFGSSTGIDAVADAPGLVGDNAWKQTTYHDAWRTGDSVNLAIGQGYLLVTPLQVANMVASVADQGTRLSPRLVLSVNGVPSPSAPVLGHLPVTQGQLQSIVAGMEGVTTAPAGTATFVYRGFPWLVAGKTGTAQTPQANPHAWFAAFAPAQSPRIAVAVVVENGGEGSYVAAPIAKDMLRAYLSQAVPIRGGGAQPLTVPGN
ncbi:MAG TPA: penicillin-binding transpeptidase domain-containing protein [Chloroflexota bacterium]|nr:penicillin-binding transpeptidase domain-containing protein [Chloroflexota bacterium]